MADGRFTGVAGGRGEDFEAEADGPAARSASSELWEFMATNKKWWLTPIVVVLLLVGALIRRCRAPPPRRSSTRLF